MSNLSQKIEELLVCPVTHSPLHRERHGNMEFFVAGNRRYPIINNVPNMVPTPPPKQLMQQWKIWEQLQRNGEIAYEEAPHLNLADKDSEQSKQFEKFINAQGLILDVGCGPQKYLPAYMSETDGLDYVGIDPLIGQQSREFIFIQGIGESLPFSSSSFDHVIFHLSLDHVLDCTMVLNEAHRILKVGGRVSISTDNIDEKQQDNNISSIKWTGIIRKGLRQLLKGIPRMGLFPMIHYMLLIMKLRVPDGAVDYFHMNFPRTDKLPEQLNDLCFEKLRKERCGEQFFISGIKRL